MKARQSVHLANANVCDADGNASPQEPHVGAHKKQEHRCGADARLSVSHVSLPYGRLLLLTFEMFSSLLPCSLYSCLFHSHKHTHTHTAPLQVSILSLKGIAFQVWIKQMGLRKQNCCFTQQQHSTLA